jgi:hypothetical protein
VASLSSRRIKRFELSNHLGNVLAVISDRKLQVLDANMTLGRIFGQYRLLPPLEAN